MFMLSRLNTNKIAILVRKMIVSYRTWATKWAGTLLNTAVQKGAVWSRKRAYIKNTHTHTHTHTHKRAR